MGSPFANFRIFPMRIQALLAAPCNSFATLQYPHPHSSTTVKVAASLERMAREQDPWISEVVNGGTLLPQLLPVW